MKSNRFASIVTAVFCLATPCIFAQTASTGTVSGQVTDPQKALVKGSAIRLIDTATSLTRTTIGNDAGRYDFPDVPPVFTT